MTLIKRDSIEKVQFVLLAALLSAACMVTAGDAWQVPASLAFGRSEIVPMCAGESLEWRLGGEVRP